MGKAKDAEREAELEKQLQETTEELEALRSGCEDLTLALAWCARENARVLWQSRRDQGEDKNFVSIRVDGDIHKQLEWTESPFEAFVNAVRAADERLERRRARIGVA